MKVENFSTMEKRNQDKLASAGKRCKKETPPFFKKLRTAGLILAAIGTSIVAAPIALPAIAVTIGGYVDRKSTRLNSSHVRISYAVFCLKKKKKKKIYN